MSEPQTFAARLRGARAAANLTQKQLADKAGLSPQTVAFLEQGRARPSWGTVQALAAALEVSTEAFRE